MNVENEVYGELVLGMSIPVINENEDMAMLEAGYKISTEAIAFVEVWITDNYGNRHKVDIHSWTSELHEFMNC